MILSCNLSRTSLLMNGITHYAKIFSAGIITSTLCTFASAHAQSYSAEGLQLLKTSQTSTEISFKGEATCSSLTGFELSSPRRYVVDCSMSLGSSARSRSRQYGLTAGGLVTSIRYGGHPDKLRLVFDLSDTATTVTFKKAGKNQFLVTVLGKATPAPKITSPTKSPTATKAAVITPSASPVAVRAETPVAATTPFVPAIKTSPTPSVTELPWVKNGEEFTITPPSTQPSKEQAPSPTPQPSIALVLPIIPEPITTATPPTTPVATPTVAPSVTPPPKEPTDIIVGIPKGETPTEIPTPVAVPESKLQDQAQDELSSQGYKVIPEDLNGKRKLGNIIFDYLPPLGVPIIRLVFSSPAEYRMSKRNDTEYILTIPDCSLRGDETKLPYFPPEDFNGFTLVQAYEESKSCKIKIGAERGIRISPYIKEREIQIRVSVG